MNLFPKLYKTPTLRDKKEGELPLTREKQRFDHGSCVHTNSNRRKKGKRGGENVDGLAKTD